MPIETPTLLGEDMPKRTTRSKRKNPRNGSGSVPRILKYARFYVNKLGLAVLVLTGKRPLTSHGVKDATKDIAQVREWIRKWPEANLGLACGIQSGLLALDFDSQVAMERFEERFGQIHAGKVITSRGFHLLLQYPLHERIRNNNNFLGLGIEIKSDGTYVVAPPSRHPDGTAYSWAPGCHLRDVGLQAPPPELLAELLRDQQESQGNFERRAPLTEATVLRGARNIYLTSLAGSLKNLQLSSHTLHAALLAENRARCEVPLPQHEIDHIVRSAERWSVSCHQHLTEMGNAKRLIQRHGQDFRYVASWKTWMLWNGKYWNRDQTGEIYRRAIETVQSIRVEAQGLTDTAQCKAQEAWGKKSESLHNIQAMVRLAQRDAKVVATPEQFDRDPMSLNVLNGTINLRTGDLRAHCQSDLHSKLVQVDYDPEAKAPRFIAFLKEIFNNDRQLINYLQRAVGYSITGNVGEQVLFFLYGRGANGKTTLLNLLLDLLGPYAVTAASHLVVRRKGDSHPTGLSDLEGKRLAVCTEVAEGSRMDEVLMKRLAGGDRLTARRMRQDYHEFRPSHKLWFGANHQPIVMGTDHAIWRRIHLVPCTVTIPDEHQDRSLAKQLQNELPGVLAWAVRGCRKWQQKGLMPPAVVRNATKSYRDSMDVFGEWLHDHCIPKSDARTPTIDLFDDYHDWATRSGYRPLTKAMFGRKLGERGYKAAKGGNGARLHIGIRLRK